MAEGFPDYWLSRFVFERALAAVYRIAFLGAAHQYVPLLGERGLLPVPRFVRLVPFCTAPSLFFLAPRDIAFRSAAWIGVGLAALALTSYPPQWGTAWSAAVWAVLWILYLSFVNVGQTFYAFGEGIPAARNRLRGDLRRRQRDPTECADYLDVAEREFCTRCVGSRITDNDLP